MIKRIAFILLFFPICLFGICEVLFDVIFWVLTGRQSDDYYFNNWIDWFTN